VSRLAWALMVIGRFSASPKARERRDLAGVQVIISDACLGLVEVAGELFPDAQWQRGVVHFYRNVFSNVPKGKVADVACMLKAIHAQEDRRSAKDKAREVIPKLRAMRLTIARKCKMGERLLSLGFHELGRYRRVSHHPSRPSSLCREKGALRRSSPKRP
jgi:transposase-like protein